ncbi:cocaine- and amphetamine-regulated transcript-like [Polypterus senegalus]|uniref:cocaine- and amphetamine-regulated transcript-like n=1 Tax=Polypterus senegalus TaxID=55291 RepID=UPI0019631714|nr:cocaine- and amphetamine-regulated transcript-like [Polypterus senegalus]
MESCSTMLVLLCVSMLLTVCHSQSSRELSAEDFPNKKTPSSAEKDLVETMEELLGKFQSRLPSYEKKGGTIPLCDVGDRCAVKLGPRIGKLCNCARGSSCNSFLLKCI